MRIEIRQAAWTVPIWEFASSSTWAIDLSLRYGSRTPIERIRVPGQTIAISNLKRAICALSLSLLASSITCLAAFATSGSGSRNAAEPICSKTPAFPAIAPTYSIVARSRSRWILRNSLPGNLSLKNSSSSTRVKFSKASRSTS